MTDLEKVEAAPAGLLDPRTGELVELDDAAKLAEVLDGLRAFKGQVQDSISAFEGALVEVSRTHGKKTLHVGDFTVEISGGRNIDWNVDLLEEELPQAGLPDERMRELVKVEVVYKVDSTVAKQIEASNPVYGEIIGRARRYVPSPTRARVKR